MVRLGRTELTWLFLLLLVVVPIKPFYSERPYIATRPPLTKDELASSHPQRGIHLSCGDNYIYSTLACADMTRRQNTTMIFALLAEVNIIIVVMIAAMVVCIFIMATFWWCHFGVQCSWAISGRYIRPRNIKRYLLVLFLTV